MILTSGVLVFAAAALLVDGVFFTSGESGTPWQIWASIVVSAAAALLLVAGAVRERSRRPAPAGGPVPPPSAPPPGRDDLRIAPAGAPTPAPAVGAAPAAEPAPLAPGPSAPPAPSAPSGRVLVVAGRPRYHRAGCRYVADRDAQELDVGEARAAGYTACGVCRPDDAGADAGAPAGAAGGWAAAAPDPVEVPAAAEPAPAGEPSPAREESPVREAPEAAEPAPTPAAPVVLVRGRYHRPDCRYVAVAAERSEVSRAEARDAGALPCGVCRP